MCHNVIDTHPQSHASPRENFTQWSSTTRKNGKLIASSSPNSIIGSFIMSFNGPDTDMSVRVGSQRNTLWMLRRWWTNSITATQGCRGSGRKGIKLAFFLFSFVIGSGPVQIALARVLQTSDHSKVEVKFPRAPYPQDDRGICFLFVSLFAFLFVCGYAAQEVCS